MTHPTDNVTLSPTEQAKILEGFNTVWKREKTNRKLKQSDIAEAMGMRQASFSGYLNGKTPISMKFLIRLCNVLKIPPQDIYPPISELLPNRRHSTIKWKTSDTQTELNNVVIYNPSIEWTTLEVDSALTWQTLNGDTMRAPEGSALVCMPLSDEGNWNWNKKIEANYYVVHLKGALSWVVLNRYVFQAMLDDENVENAYILMGIRVL